MRWLTIYLLSALGLYASTTPSCPKHALYMIHKGQVNPALEIYQNYLKEHTLHDTEFLQQLGLGLLEQGSKNSDPETQLMALFGAGLAMHELSLPILTRAISSSNPQLQLIALNFLERYQHDDADRYAFEGLRSNYLLVRMEALHQIASKKSLKATNHIDSLVSKVNPELLPLFPQLYALVGDTDAVRRLKQLLAHSQEAVRIEAIISCARAGRDDLLPKIRVLAAHGSIAQQEAGAFTLGVLRDDSSIPFLTNLSRTASSHTVCLAALKALVDLGQQEALKTIQTMALQGNLYAIHMLSDIPGTQETLAQLLQSPDFSIRINAALSLLHQQDPRAVALLPEILIKDARDLAFEKSQSQGKSLAYWKPIFSARQQFEDSSIDLELSLNFRETILEEVSNLPQEFFLPLVKLIFDKQQNDLVPTAISLLENLNTPKALELLKTYSQHPGAPLIRSYCNLALYRLHEAGPYAQNLALWLQQQNSENLIQLRPLVPWELNDTPTTHQITPHETSRLLVESFEALTRKQDFHGIDCLLEAIKNGHNKNKYALAGLLIRATL